MPGSDLGPWPALGKAGRAWTRCDPRYGTGLYADDPDQCFVCGQFRKQHKNGELCMIPKKEPHKFCVPSRLRNGWLRSCNKFYTRLAERERNP